MMLKLPLKLHDAALDFAMYLVVGFEYAKLENIGLWVIPPIFKSINGFYRRSLQKQSK